MIFSALIIEGSGTISSYIHIHLWPSRLEAPEQALDRYP